MTHGHPTQNGDFLVSLKKFRAEKIIFISLTFDLPPTKREIFLRDFWS